MSATTLCRLASKQDLCGDIAVFRFESLDQPFTGLEPGAHVDLHLPGPFVRQYSLCDWDPAGAWLEVAVKREAAGRGGSMAVHALTVGRKLEIGGPRNHFALEVGERHYTLIAGGIGITPIFTMARRLAEVGADFRLFYLVRSRDLAAFAPRIEALGLGDRVRTHCDDTDGRFDFADVLGHMPAGGEVYTCGPEPMLNALLEAGSHLRSGAIRFERFAPASDLDHGPNAAFEVELRSTGAVYSVPCERSILEVLSSKGVRIDSGCSEGLCGSCITNVLDGEIDHRDGVLSPEEQATNEFMCVCVSRARSRRLVLDL